MKIRNLEKPCKRKKCPYYNTRTNKCSLCEYNPNAEWTERKAKR